MDNLGNRLNVSLRDGRDETYVVDELTNRYKSIGLVGHWKFNETQGTTATDSSGNGNDATLQNGAAWDFNGKLNGCVTLDGVNDYLSCANAPKLSIQDNITVSLWFKPESFTSGYANRFFRKYSSTSDGNYVLYFFGNNGGANPELEGRLQFYANRGGTWGSVSGLYYVTTLDQWYHVAWTYNSSDGGQLYVNGQAVGSRTASSTLATNSQPLLMGDSSYFDGSLDNVMLFNRELTASEIASLYATQIEDTIAYDAAGNLVEDKDGYKYTYDYENRVVKIEKPDGSGGWDDVAEMAYDALGRRIRVIDSIASTTTLYYYNPEWQCLAEYNGAGALQRYFVYGNYIDEPLVMHRQRDGEDYYYGQDHLYSTAVLIDDGGNVVERYEYDAYGTAHIMDASYNSRTVSSYGNPYTFTGRRLDVLDGGDLLRMHYRHRDYDVYMARFLQHDPEGYSDGLGLYQYCLSMAIRATDPLGLRLIIDPPGDDIGTGLPPFISGYPPDIYPPNWDPWGDDTWYPHSPLGCKGTDSCATLIYKSFIITGTIAGRINDFVSHGDWDSKHWRQIKDRIKMLGTCIELIKKNCPDKKRKCDQYLLPAPCPEPQKYYITIPQSIPVLPPVYVPQPVLPNPTPFPIPPDPSWPGLPDFSPPPLSAQTVVTTIVVGGCIIAIIYVTGGAAAPALILL